MSNLNKKEIAEINEGIREALADWSEIMLMADNDGWSEGFGYTADDVLSATIIFTHILNNYGQKNGVINLDNAEVFGERIRSLVQDMAHLDTKSIADGTFKELN